MEKKPELSVRVERPPVGSSYSWDQVFGYLKDLAKAVPGVEFFSHITNLAGLSSREMSSDMESFDEVSRLALDTHTPGARSAARWSLTPVSGPFPLSGVRSTALRIMPAGAAW